MILPTALITRWPDPRYHVTDDKAASIRANVQDALWHLRESQRLRATRLPGIDKAQRRHNRWVKKQVDVTIKRMEDILKGSDYAAMAMASWPEAEFMDRNFYRTRAEQVTGPILVRGIASGKIMQQHRDRGHDYYFIETGYFGNYRGDNNRTGRKLWHRICHNEMQHSRIMRVPDDRWRTLVQHDPGLEYQGWRSPGGRILLVTPSLKPCEHFGINQQQWIKDTCDQLRQHTDREIVIRNKAARHTRTNNTTIYDSLNDDIWCVVTFNSIAAVEAVAWGVPAIALAPTAAAPVAGHDLSMIESPPRPSPELVQQWLWSLAYGQFNWSELLTGQAWRTVQENLQRETLDI